MSRNAAILVLILAAFSLYANTLLNGFVDDDQFQVVRNPWIQDLRRLPEAFSRDVWGFVAPEGGPPYYRPLMHVVYAAEYRIFGLKAWGFHLGNVVLHASCTVMVFLLGLRLAATGAPPARVLAAPPFAAALLFAAHPAHTEAVAWIAALPDLGVTLFYLTALLCHTRAGRPLDRCHVASAAAFLAALLFKETALTLPLALVASDVALGTRRSGARGHLGIYGLHLAALALYLALRYQALAEPFPAVVGGEGSGLLTRVLSAFALYGDYLWTLLAPVDLSFWRTFQPVVSPLSARALIALAVAAASLIGLILAFRKERAVFVALSVGILPLIPVLHFGGLPGKPFAERYLYLPSAGLILAAFFALHKAWGGRRWSAWLILIPLLPFCAAATVQRNAVWRDPITLFSDTVRKSPDVAILRYQLAVALQEAGRIDEAIAEYRLLVGSDPRVARYRASLGDALMLKGSIDDAIEHLEAAVELDPRSREAYNDLGTAHQAKGRTGEAVDAYRKALAIDPGYAAAHYNLGAALSAGGMVAEAMTHLEEAVRLDSANAHYHNILGIEYAKQGRGEAAIEQFEAAVRLAPAEPGYRRNLDAARQRHAR